MIEAPPSTHRILGIDFFDGSAKDAIALMRDGGLLVVPAAPALKDLETNRDYRDALLNADLALTDSAFMVLIWNRLQSRPITRLSGLEYLRVLLLEPDVRQSGNTLWIMANPVGARRNLSWLAEQGIAVPEDNIYMAPMYGSADISDPPLLDRLNRLRAQHIIVHHRRRHAGAPRPLPQTQRLSYRLGDPLHRRGHRLSQRRSGPHPHMGGQVLPWLAPSLHRRTKTLRPPLLVSSGKLLPLMLRYRGPTPGPQDVDPDWEISRKIKSKKLACF